VGIEVKTEALSSTSRRSITPQRLFLVELREAKGRLPSSPSDGGRSSATGKSSHLQHRHSDRKRQSEELPATVPGILSTIHSPDTSGLSSDTRRLQRRDKGKALDESTPSGEHEMSIRESSDSQAMAVMGLLSEVGLPPNIASGEMLERLKETLEGWERRSRAGSPRSDRPDRRKSTPELRKELTPSKVLSTSTTQTMRMVNQSLSMPQQPNETSSAANAQHRALERSRKPPATRADNTTESRMNSISQTPSGSGKASPTSRVANQRYRNSAIKDGYTTNIPDQGISIDASG
jgi:hypothetical protein